MIRSFFSAPNATIFRYRQFVLQLDIPEAARHPLLKESVINMAGTNVWFSLFPDTMQNLLVAHHERFSIPDPAKWEELKAKIVYSTYDSNGLSECIRTTDRPENLENSKIIGERCDLSWTSIGARLLEEKSRRLLYSLKTVQAAARGLLARRKTLAP